MQVIAVVAGLCAVGLLIDYFYILMKGDKQK